MTNLEALGATVSYPVDDLKLKKILIDNGISPTDEYAGISKAFEVATASVYVLLVSAANIGESGYSVSMTDKSNMIKLASGIYAKYGLQNPLTANSIRNRSYYW